MLDVPSFACLDALNDDTDMVSLVQIVCHASSPCFCCCCSGTSRIVSGGRPSSVARARSVAPKSPFLAALNNAEQHLGVQSGHAGGDFQIQPFLVGDEGMGNLASIYLRRQGGEFSHGDGSVRAKQRCNAIPLSIAGKDRRIRQPDRRVRSNSLDRPEAFVVRHSSSHGRSYADSFRRRSHVAARYKLFHWRPGLFLSGHADRQEGTKTPLLRPCDWCREDGHACKD